MSDEPHGSRTVQTGVARTHQDIHLADEGGTIISGTRPAVFGECQLASTRLPGAVLATLHISTPLPEGTHYASNDSTLVPVLSAWNVDEQRMTFVPIGVNGLRCPRNGIFTKDGGP